MAAKAGWHRNYVAVTLCIATVKRRERGCGTADLEYFEAVSDVVVVDVDVERLVVVEAAVVAVDVLTDQPLLGVHADEVHLHIDTHTHTHVYTPSTNFIRTVSHTVFILPPCLSGGIPFQASVPFCPLSHTFPPLRSRPHCPHCG